MSTTLAPERIEQIIEEPFVIEGWDDVPQCESDHISLLLFLGKKVTSACSHTANHVMLRTCDMIGALWCANRAAEHIQDCVDLDTECGSCRRGIEECWTIRSL